MDAAPRGEGVRLSLPAALSAALPAPLLWLTATLLAYLFAVRVYLKSGRQPALIPVATGVTVIVLLLSVTGTPYAEYFESTRLIHFWVGPLIVALAVPLYHQVQRLKAIWWPVTVALLAGSVVAVLSGVLIARALGGSHLTQVSVAGKSATMPIAMALAERSGGLVPIAAVAVALTGFAGIVLARPLLALCRINDPAVRGFAEGLTAHALGAARALQTNETAGAFAALAMALNGVMTAVLVPLTFWLLQQAGWGG